MKKMFFIVNFFVFISWFSSEGYAVFRHETTEERELKQAIEQSLICFREEEELRNAIEESLRCSQQSQRGEAEPVLIDSVIVGCSDFLTDDALDLIKIAVEHFPNKKDLGKVYYEEEHILKPKDFIEKAQSLFGRKIEDIRKNLIPLGVRDPSHIEESFKNCALRILVEKPESLSIDWSKILRNPRNAIYVDGGGNNDQNQFWFGTKETQDHIKKQMKTQETVSAVLLNDMCKQSPTQGVDMCDKDKETDWPCIITDAVSLIGPQGTLEISPCSQENSQAFGKESRNVLTTLGFKQQSSSQKIITELYYNITKDGDKLVLNFVTRLKQKCFTEFCRA